LKPKLGLMENLKQCDVFARRVTLKYRGNGRYSTWGGALMTLIVFVGYLVMVAFKTTEYITLTTAVRSITTEAANLNEMIDLRTVGFDFAVEAVGVGYAKLAVYQVNWNAEDGRPEETEIALKPCTELRGIPLTNAYTDARDGKRREYVCPDRQVAMKASGDYFSKQFSYVKLSAEACQDSCSSEPSDGVVRLVLLRGTVDFGE